MTTVSCTHAVSSSAHLRCDRLWVLALLEQAVSIEAHLGKASQECSPRFEHRVQRRYRVGMLADGLRVLFLLLLGCPILKLLQVLLQRGSLFAWRC